MPTKAEIETELLPLTGASRENYILSLALSPDAAALPNSVLSETWQPVTVNKTINGIDHVLTYWVAPDYYKAGIRLPMLPGSAQRVADATSSILPSRKMVLDIYNAATVKLPFIGFWKSKADSATNVTSGRYIESDNAIEAQLAALGRSAKTDLLAGHKKDIVVHPNDDGSHVTIYDPEPYGGNVLQPYSPLAHGSDYVDYSHGVRLIYHTGQLDGKPAELSDIFQDPVFWPLVSDQGPFLPRFPNVGSKAGFNPPSTPSVPFPSKPSTPSGGSNAASPAGGIGIAALGVVALGGLLFTLTKIRG